MAADECPSTVCTCFTLAPPEISADAVKWRNECVSTSSPVATCADLHARFHRWYVSGSPSSVVNSAVVDG